MREVYSSLPEKNNPETSREDRLRVLQLLQTHIDQDFTAAMIAKRVGLPVDQTQVHVRKVITELIEHHSQPIVAGSKGFRYTHSEEALVDYAASLEGRVRGIQARIYGVRGALDRLRCIKNKRLGDDL